MIMFKLTQLIHAHYAMFCILLGIARIIDFHFSNALTMITVGLLALLLDYPL